jgi:hypothetical protein
MLVDFHEIAERYRKDRFFHGGEWIDPQAIFEARDQHGKAERVEPAIGQREVVLERRENFACSRAICSICSIMVNLTDIACLLFLYWRSV